MTQAVFGTGAGARTVSCVYDGFGRLKKVNDNGKETEYTYDADGLRSGKSAGGSTERYVYDNGQLVAAVSRDDAGGTLIADFTLPEEAERTVQIPELVAGKRYYAVIGGVTYSAVAQYVKGEPMGPATFAFDERPEIPPVAPYDRIILDFGTSGVAMEMANPEGPAFENGTKNVYVVGYKNAHVKLYDGDPASAGTSTTETKVEVYIRGLGLIASRAGQNVTYYHYDAHGNVIQTTDANGNLVKNYYYDAFGVEQNADPADTNPFRYCGEQYDTETGNYYLRARYYAPGTGRFTQEDPIRDGLNWYAYCAGNPVRYIDSSGMGPEDWFDTLDEAAIDAGNYLMPKTSQDQEERLACFYININGKYKYEEISNTYSEHGGNNVEGFYIERIPNRTLAILHTHSFWALDINEDNRVFSYPGNSSAGEYNDAGFVRDQGIPLYLATPAGEIKVLEPGASYEGRLVSNESYVDPGYAFRYSLAWPLVLNRFSTVSPMEVLNVYRQQSDLGRRLFLTVEALKAIEAGGLSYER